MKDRLFELSIKEDDSRYKDLLEKKPEYYKQVTFRKTKQKPVYNWFHYKEGYDPELIWNLTQELDLEEGQRIIDPFCGTGTTLLAARENGFPSMGIDALPLCVFVANTKLQKDYDMEKLRKKIQEITSLDFDNKKRKWPEIGFFNVKKAYSSYAYSDILFFREKIAEIEDKKIRNFLLLGLLSIVIAAGNVQKDGGVLKIKKRENIPPVRILLRNRLKRMYKDLKKRNPQPDIEAKARMQDARNPNLPEAYFDACITSPPYLNWVDYTKVYAIEQSLLLTSDRELERLRKNMVRSYLGAKSKRKPLTESETLDRVMEKLHENPDSKKPPATVEAYFADMEAFLGNLRYTLKENSAVAIVVGNACMPSLTVDSDIILAEMAQSMGYTVERILVAHVRWCNVEGIKKDRPVRESIVILRK